MFFDYTSIKKQNNLFLPSFSLSLSLSVSPSLFTLSLFLSFWFCFVLAAISFYY